MARWTNIAKWRGPSPNVGGRMQSFRGLVVHIADGYYEGTIAWQRNPQSNISSHFVVGRNDGEIAQMVDTSTIAWTQGAGNGHWLSVECAGFTKGHHLNPGGWERLSPHQIDAVAKLLVECNKRHDVPLVVTSSPSGRGLGHHSMGSPSWGHPNCPGTPIINQKPEIVKRAKELAGGNVALTKADARTLVMADVVPAPDIWLEDNPPKKPGDETWTEATYWRTTRDRGVRIERVVNNHTRDLDQLKAGQAAIFAKLDVNADMKTVIDASLDEFGDRIKNERLQERTELITQIMEMAPAVARAVAESLPDDIDTTALASAFVSEIGNRLSPPTE